MRSVLIALPACAAVVVAAASGGAAPAAELLFRDRVQPLLTARCVRCHGGASPQGGLDLSSAAAARSALLRRSDGAGATAPPLLLRRVVEGSMPPGERLPEGEVALLRRWVQETGLPVGSTGRGGPAPAPTRAGRDWWSLQPLKVVATPPAAAVRTGQGTSGRSLSAARDAARSLPMPQSRVAGAASDGRRPPQLLGTDLSPRAAVGQVVDRFVEARLRRVGLRFAAVASRAVYLRRLTYDLHGLPPSRDEMVAFERDTRPDACERVVDRLLASPRFGERQARRWLDAVRFAESDGYEHDLPRPDAWPYRDWVIEAFNQDMPYDRFVREQLAGDVLHPDDPEAGRATGFLVAGCFDAVGAKQAAENFRAEVRQDELEDMIAATSQVFLGLTTQCARCHDHKFDPIPQRDYYRFQAALAGARHWAPEQKRPFRGVRSEAPAVTRLLHRGQITEPGPVVTPGGLSALAMLPADLNPTPDGDGPRRRALAEWITYARNPLLTRVMVNRVWGWLFGRGLVATPNDFGAQGARPTHPELLDWLAAWFAGRVPAQDGSGSGHHVVGVPYTLKRLFRALVLSRAYRQSSKWDARAAATDAENQLLWRHTPRRLEAEEVRDTLLLAAGRLDLRMGGPGFALFTWTNNAGALYRPVAPEGDADARRAIYRTVVRGFEDSLLAGLDCPDPSALTPRRQTSTTAPQALSLLNHPFVHAQAERLATRLRRESGTADPSAAIRRSYVLALGREASAAEADRAAAFAARHGLAAWCRLLFNTSEFLAVE